MYHRLRDNDLVGTEAAGLAYDPGTFSFRDTGFWASGPIVENRVFAFGNFEDEEDERPLTTFRANRGGEPVAGNTTRVLASDLQALSAFLSQNFGYETGPFEEYPDLTPARRYLLRTDYNLGTNNKASSATTLSTRAPTSSSPARARCCADAGRTPRTTWRSRTTTISSWRTFDRASASGTRLSGARCPTA